LALRASDEEGGQIPERLTCPTTLGEHSAPDFLFVFVSLHAGLTQT